MLPNSPKHINWQDETHYSSVNLTASNNNNTSWKWILQTPQQHRHLEPHRAFCRAAGHTTFQGLEMTSSLTTSLEPARSMSYSTSFMEECLSSWTSQACLHPSRSTRFKTRPTCLWTSLKSGNWCPWSSSMSSSWRHPWMGFSQSSTSTSMDQGQMWPSSLAFMRSSLTFSSSWSSLRFGCTMLTGPCIRSFFTSMFTMSTMSGLHQLPGNPSTVIPLSIFLPTSCQLPWDHWSWALMSACCTFGEHLPQPCPWQPTLDIICLSWGHLSITITTTWSSTKTLELLGSLICFMEQANASQVVFKAWDTECCTPQNQLRNCTQITRSLIEMCAWKYKVWWKRTFAWDHYFSQLYSLLFLESLSPLLYYSSQWRLNCFFSEQKPIVWHWSLF